MCKGGFDGCQSYFLPARASSSQRKIDRVEGRLPVSMNEISTRRRSQWRNTQLLPHGLLFSSNEILIVTNYYEIIEAVPSIL